MNARPKARRPKGFPDSFPAQVSRRKQMLARICEVYERFGFVPLETSCIEYVDALGKFLPEKDQPEQGIFAFRDDMDDQWLGLRYDLTAPLARFVAEHLNSSSPLPRPFRRYQYGPVWRRERKPGKDRFRQFYQCDFDTVGSDSPVADAEVCDVLANALRALGIDEFVIRVNNRKVLNGLLENLGFKEQSVRSDVLRALDKLGDVGREGVEKLLGEGRKDKSGSFDQGLGLDASAISSVLDFLQTKEASRPATCERLLSIVGDNVQGKEGVDELVQIDEALRIVGLEEDRVSFEPSLTRGLDYYTGPVFEIELPFEVSVKGKKKKFGSVAGGGRYDYLVERFTGEKIPATGASIGVDRLLAALEHVGDLHGSRAAGPVVVTVLDKSLMAEYQRMVMELRNAGVAAELYLGGKGMKAQLKYVDRKSSSIAVIAGKDEFKAGQVTLKDMQLGKQMSAQIEDNKEWRQGQPAQHQVPRDGLVEAVLKLLSAEEA